jgi:hypothetical protein
LRQRQAVAGDQGVAGVRARRHRGDGQAVRGRGREVLVRVDREVDLLGEQRVAQRGDEDAHAEALHGRAGPVAGRGDLDQLDVVAGGGAQRVGDSPGLGERQGAAPGAEPQRGHGL